MRVKDIDFDYQSITLHDGKGNKDRVAMLPKSIVTPLREQLEVAKALHESDLRESFGEVFMPDACP